MVPKGQPPGASSLASWTSHPDDESVDGRHSVLPELSV